MRGVTLRSLDYLRGNGFGGVTGFGALGRLVQVEGSEIEFALETGKVGVLGRQVCGRLRELARARGMALVEEGQRRFWEGWEV